MLKFNTISNTIGNPIGHIYETIKHYVDYLSHRQMIALCIYCLEPFEKLQLYIKNIQQWFDFPQSFNFSDYEHLLTISQYLIVNDSLRVCCPNEHNKNYHTIWAVIGCWDYNKSKIIPYLDALVNTKIPKTPFTDPLEIIVYLQDQELYPILDGNRLNLWDRDYEYQVTGSIEEILNTIGIRNLLNVCISE